MNRFQVFRCADEMLRWRLVGGNNRVIGLSPFPFASAEQGGEHVLSVRRLAEGRALAIATDRGEDGWTWRLDDTTCPAAVGPGSFARRADAQVAARRFLQRAGSAQIMQGVIAHLVTSHPLSLCGQPVRARGAGRNGAVTST